MCKGQVVGCCGYCNELLGSVYGKKFVTKRIWAAQKGLYSVASVMQGVLLWWSWAPTLSRDMPAGADSLCDGATVPGDTTSRTVSRISTWSRVSCYFDRTSLIQQNKQPTRCNNKDLLMISIVVQYTDDAAGLTSRQHRRCIIPQAVNTV